MNADDAVIAAAEAILDAAIEHFDQEALMETDTDARHRFVQRWNLVAQAIGATWNEFSALVGPYGAGEFDEAMARLNGPDRQRAEFLVDTWVALQEVVVPLRAERELHDLPKEGASA